MALFAAMAALPDSSATPETQVALFVKGEDKEVYSLRRRWFHSRLHTCHDDAASESLRLAVEAAPQGMRLNSFGHSEDRTAYLERRQWYRQRACEALERVVELQKPEVAAPIEIAHHAWSALLRACAVMTLVLSVWFSANAVLGEIADEYGLLHSDASLLTAAVNVGFMIAATTSAVLQLPDRVATSRLVLTGALCCVASNAALLSPWPLPFAMLLAARLLTGAALSLIYPVLMRNVASWFASKQRGLALGCVVGSLVLGIALPSLVRALLPDAPWRRPVLGTSALALVGSAVAWGLRDGPHVRPAGKGMSLAALALVVRNRAWIFVTLSYMGHNFELFAGWAWMGAFLQEYFDQRTPGGKASPMVGSAAAFAVVAIGSLGCIMGGIASDAVGRRRVIMASHLTSGVAIASLPYVAVAPPFITLGVAGIWGFAAIADSAQYSAMISETLRKEELLGSALALSLALGFFSTTVGIYAVPLLYSWGGWSVAFPCASLGSFAGMVAMLAVPAPGKVESV